MSILVNSLLTIAGLYMVTSFIGGLVKSNADHYFPNADSEGEIEALLAEGLALALAKDAA
jgi:hypothetical protein